HYETVRVTKEGNRINVSLTVSPIIAGGKVIGASKIARDITQKKRAEEEREELLAPPHIARGGGEGAHPRKGQIPGDSFARTTHAADGHARLVNDVAQWAPGRGNIETRARYSGTQRAGTGPADRRFGRCVANCRRETTTRHAAGRSVGIN